jgi:hypothetical protein
VSGKDIDYPGAGAAVYFKSSIAVEGFGFRGRLHWASAVAKRGDRRERGQDQQVKNASRLLGKQSRLHVGSSLSAVRLTQGE